MTKRNININKSHDNKIEISSNTNVLTNNYKNIKKNRLSLFKLPSVKLCLLNSQPITSFYLTNTSNLSDLSNKDSKNNDHNLVSNNYSNKRSNQGNLYRIHNRNRHSGRYESPINKLNNIKVDKKKVEKLKNELYAMNILNRLIKLGINNKLNILSLYKFNSVNVSGIISPEKNDQQGLLHGNENNFINSNNGNLVNLFVKSMLNKQQRQLNNSKNKTEAQNKLNFSNSIFSILDFCLPGFVFNDPKEQQDKSLNNNLEQQNNISSNSKTQEMHNNNIKQKIMQQEKEELEYNLERKINNLLKNKLCNGNEINFTKFILSILLVNKFDFLPPHFINLLLNFFINNFNDYSKNLNNIL